MNSSQYILIVASSGRMLAQAAKSAGLKPLVVDLFADIDTQGYATEFRKISSLAEQHLTPAIHYFTDRYAVSQIIYGSGFEYYPESLYYLNSCLTLLGNSPDTFVKLHNQPEFFSLLNSLNIAHPDVIFNAPDVADNWLVKPMQGQGGRGIHRFNKNTIESNVYWQKYQAGTQHSVLFLANGQVMQVLGFNTQWAVGLSETEEFIFSGIVNNGELPDEHKALVISWLDKIVPLFALKGLNSLDFILSDNKCYVLEINPRPSASMQLYDGDLIAGHIKASQGKLSPYNFVENSYKGYRIVYASEEVLIPDGFLWPKWCMDLPEPGTLIQTGQPICSIIVHQNEPVLVSCLQHLAETLIQSILENESIQVKTFRRQK
ncbi:MAG: ATP-grasp domain-containing protein [Methylococcales bacterium]|nr:ATP-grasp domain-containing protein [Methylococcales bacterium]